MLKSIFDTDPRYLWPAFSAFQADGDTSGCVSVFDRLAPFIYSGLSDIDRSLPPIVSSFMPKSGGTFLHNRMIKSLGYKEFHWGITLAIDPMGVFVSKKALELFLRGGCTSHTHMVPHPHNIDIFNSFGVSKIWVHVRDPRDAAMAAYYHYLGIGQGEGAIADERISANKKQAGVLGISVGKGSRGEIDKFLSEHLLHLVSWIESWLVFDQLNPGSLVITAHTEFGNISKLLRDVLKNFGYGVPIDIKVDGNLPEDRRRLGPRLSWKEFAGPASEDFGNKIIEERLDPFAVWREISGSNADLAPQLEFPAYIDIPQARPGKIGIANRVR